MKSGDWTYIWQDPAWPEWRYDLSRVTSALTDVAQAQGLLLGRLADDLRPGKEDDGPVLDRAVQLELLVPRQWRHPSQEFLRAWYGRLGYRLVRTTTLDEDYPHLAPLLATACDLEIHEKPL